MLESKALLLVKQETTYGTDATPSAAANAIIATIPQIEIIGNNRTRNLVMPGLGMPAGVNVAEGVKISFSTELKASTAPGEPTAISPLFEACGLTMTDGTSTVTFARNSDFASAASVTIWFYKDGILHKIQGARGTFKFNFKVNEIMMIDFEFTGKYALTNIIDQSIASGATYESQAPIVFRNANFAINSYAGLIESFEFDLGNTISARRSANESTGISQYVITNNQISGSVDPEVVLLATFNPFDLYNDSTAVAITVTGYDDNSGTEVTYALAAVQLDVPKYAARDNITVYNLGFKSTSSLTSAHSDLTITFS